MVARKQSALDIKIASGIADSTDRRENLPHGAEPNRRCCGLNRVRQPFRDDMAIARQGEAPVEPAQCLMLVSPCGSAGASPWRVAIGEIRYPLSRFRDRVVRSVRYCFVGYHRRGGGIRFVSTGAV